MGKGADYQAVFSERRDLALHWEIEQRLLDEIVTRRFGGGPFRYLDFACGTGRILAHVERRAGEATGVDLSPTMLQVARQRVQRARIVEGDLTRDDLLGDARFDLITCFRFFPNAQPALRAQVMERLVAHLAPQGLLVFNNHQNHRGLRRRLVRAVGRDPGHEMRTDEVDTLVRGAGLRVLRRHGVGLLPLSHRMIVAPVPILARVEHGVADTPVAVRWATSILYECVHAS